LTYLCTSDRGPCGSAAQSQRSLNSVGASLSNLGIVLRIHARHADAAHDLTVDHDGDAAFDHRRPADGEIFQSYTAAGYHISEDLGRPAKLDRGGGLAIGDTEGSKLRAVESETLLSGAAAACAKCAKRAQQLERTAALLSYRSGRREPQHSVSGGGQDRLKRSLMNSGSHPEAVLGPGAIARCSTTTRRSTSPFR